MTSFLYGIFKVDKNVTPARIQFNSEIELNRVLNFADLSIKRLDGKFIMKVYRKGTHTNKYINWRSNDPKSYITGTMKTPIYRAYDLCTLREDREGRRIGVLERHIYCE